MFKNRPFLLLWSAQAISQTAQNVLNFALLIEVERISGSSTQVSLVILSFIVPAILVGPVAGVFVDRADKRRVLLASNFLRAAVALAYIAIGESWPTAGALMAIYLLSVAFSTISQFFAPAEASTIPLLVSSGQLVRANSLFSLTFTSSQLVGFALLGPLLVKLTALPTLFVVVSALYVICTLLVAFLPALREGLRMGETDRLASGLHRVWSEIHELWRYMSSDRAVAAAIVELAVPTTLFLVLGTLGVGMVTRVFGLRADDLAYLVAAGGVGMLLGLLAVPRMTSTVGSSALIESGMATMGASILAMAGASSALTVLLGGIDTQMRGAVAVIVLAFLAAGIGVGSAFVSVPAQTLLQQRSPVSLRGRVFAAFFTVSSALAILPVLFTAVLADLIGIPEVMALIGLSTIALAISGRYSRTHV